MGLCRVYGKCAVVRRGFLRSEPITGTSHHGALSGPPWFWPRQPGFWPALPPRPPACGLYRVTVSRRPAARPTSPRVLPGTSMPRGSRAALYLRIFREFSFPLFFPAKELSPVKA
jgi:hypothetical protein